MSERMNTVGYAGQVRRFRPEQIAQQSTWDGVPDTQKTAAAMHTIHMKPAGSSTITYVNPLDPGSDPKMYKFVPGTDGPITKAWRP